MFSNFDTDLTNEALLAKYLDGIYPKLFKGFSVERILDFKQQQQGIDLKLSKALFLNQKHHSLLSNRLED